MYVCIYIFYTFSEVFVYMFCFVCSSVKISWTVRPMAGFLVSPKNPRQPHEEKESLQKYELRTKDIEFQNILQK